MTNHSILLVEDNPDDVELTLRVLKSKSVAKEIVVAKDGQEALDLLFEKNHAFSLKLPSVVILDLKMPKVDGMDVLRQLRAEPRTSALPIVVMTTSNEEQDVVTSYQLGANSYVRKPLGYEEFEQAVLNLGLYWLSLNVTLDL